MNPFVKTYIDQINGLVAELTRTLEQYEAQCEQTQDAKETLLKQNWSAQRQINALQETLDRLPELDNENRELKIKRQQSLEHAKRILAYAKALSGAMQK